MSLKVNLFIMFVIAVSLVLIIKIFMTEEPEQAPAPPPKQVIVSPYSITISSASWGLNCRDYYTRKNSGKNSGYYSGDSDEDEAIAAAINKIKDNNVLYKVSQLCNDKPQCEIEVSQSVLGEDPLPNCGYKELKVEYRCFAVDRLRRAKSGNSPIIINCEQETKKLQ